MAVFQERLTGWDLATSTRARNTSTSSHVKVAVKKYCRRATTAAQPACSRVKDYSKLFYIIALGSV